MTDHKKAEDDEDLEGPIPVDPYARRFPWGRKFLGAVLVRDRKTVRKEKGHTDEVRPEDQDD